MTSPGTEEQNTSSDTVERNEQPQTDSDVSRNDDLLNKRKAVKKNVALAKGSNYFGRKIDLKQVTDPIGLWFAPEKSS